MRVSRQGRGASRKGGPLRPPERRATTERRPYERRGCRGFLLAATCCLGILCWLGVPAAGQDLGAVSDLRGLPALGGGEIRQESSANAQANGDDFLVIEAGETKTIAQLEGPGVVERVWLTAKCRDDLFLRKVLIRGYWDGEGDPSIDSPLGDFFGVGFGLYRQYASLLLGMSSGGYYCYFPMPFARSARFEIVNEGEMPITKFYFQITYRRLDRLPEDEGYFHAKWRREEMTKKGEDYVVLDARGKGKFVGCVLSLQGDPGVEAKFMEGDEKFYVDSAKQTADLRGAEEPSIRGTGIEDYFNSGWYFKEGEFAAPLHGCTLLDREGNRVSAYRFHVSDAIPFEKSLRMTVSHGEDNEWPADFSSVAYWYQKEPHWEFAPMPGAAARVPKEVATPSKGGGGIAGQGKAVAGSEPRRATEAAPTGPVFWEGYYRAGELALPFLACLVGLLGLGYVLRRVMRRW